MENNNGMPNQNLAALKQMFGDFAKKQQSQSSKKKSRENLLAKYFVPRNSREIFRILPPKAGKKHIEEAFFHVVPTNAAGGKKKHGTVVYCPAHNDPKVQKLGADGKPVLDANGQPIMIPAPCPLCAKHKKLLSRQDQSLKGVKKESMTEAQKVIKAKNDEIYKEAIKWEAKKFYIVRGIDKGAEKDGVKFWRFKHNYKNQGTLDKLLPILQDYIDLNQADFSDPVNGTDLSITMTDSEFNGFIYKSISAISARGKSPLSSDPLVVRTWLDDPITWRDVFKPKQAPNCPPYDFLVLIAEGNSPYWDDTDANNKHWVFPNHPDLEELANTRNRNLDADEEDNFEYASDMDDEYPAVTVTNITESKVGTFKDDASDFGKETLAETKVTPPTPTQTPETNTQASSGSDYDDLPF